VRMAVLEEQLQVLLGNWGSEPFSLDGEYYVLSDLDAEPKPVQQPHPPVIMGGNAGPRSAALAARFADEYNTPFPSLDEIRERRARIVEACERVGREPIPFSIMASMVLGADAADLEDRARRMGKIIDTDGDALRREPPKGWIVGTVEQAAEQFATLRDAGVGRVMCQLRAHDDLDAVALIGELGRQLT
jgi:alkanesulfonate monooxygenase SsuD/methylene tetrahydromethanopterin reductase-like flavin-dependent oxidoreductase (luciferase family)